MTASDSGGRAATEDAEELDGVEHEQEHGELVAEAGSLITGAEVLFAFLVAISFTEEFEEAPDVERYVYYAALLSAGLGVVLFLAPAAQHRLRFGRGETASTLRRGNREAIAGTFLSCLSFTAVVFLVTDRVFGTWEAVVAATLFFAFAAWRWWSFNLYRALREDRRQR